MQCCIKQKTGASGRGGQVTKADALDRKKAQQQREIKKKRTRVGQLTTVEEKKEAKENCYTIIEGAQGCFRSTCFRITQRISTEKKTKKRTQDMHIVETFIQKPQHQSEEMRKMKQAGMKRNCAGVMRRKERG